MRKKTRLMTASAIGAGIVSILMAGAASAQTAVQTPSATQVVAQPQVESEVIIVRGFRKSLRQARDLKRLADISSDSIIAEDMSKFPDLNLAESLQRLPGVAIKREGGEGRRISLRGLGPDFTRVQMNGMEVLGNVDSPMDSRGQSSRDRAFDFNIFASELFSKVEVRKSFSAEQDEGGLAGTIGLFTGKPFAYQPGQKLAFSLQGGTNTATEDFQPRASALYSYNWDNKFGVLLSVAYSQRQTEEQGYNTYSSFKFSTTQIGQLSATTPLGTGLNLTRLSAQDQAKVRSSDLIFPRGNRLSVWGSEQERLGITFAAQWRPIESMTLTLDVMRGEFENERSELHLATRANGNSTVLGAAFQGGGRLINGVTVNSIRFDDNNSVLFADVDNTVFATETRRQSAKTLFEQFVFTGDWQVNEALSVNGHIGKETSDYDIPISDKFYMEAIGGLVTDYSQERFNATNTYKWDTSNFANYRAHEIDFAAVFQTTELDNAELNTAYKFNASATLKAGISYRKFFNSGFQQTNDDVNLAAWQTGALSDNVAPYAVLFTGHNAQPWVIADWDKALATYNVTRTLAPPRAGTVYSVEEATNAAYLQLDWNRTLFGIGLRGNVGLRAFETELTSKGTARVRGVETPVVATNTYSDVLPSLNMVLEVSDAMQVRLALGRNINRPGVASYSVAGTVTQDATTGAIGVSAGNPNLKPYYSDEAELAFEWYFGNVGMMTAGLFHKKIDGFISNRVVRNVPYGETGLPLNLLPGLTETTVVDSYSRPINLAKGELTGLEISAQSDFFFLPAPFDKFGVVANLTLIDSSITNFGVKDRFEGLSDVNQNFTLYYETGNWGARISSNFRSDYITNSIDPANLATSGGGFNSSLYVDAAAFYQLTPKVRLTLDAINLTDEQEEQYNTTYRRLWNSTKSGTTVFFGANMQF
jgi:iron complex outermembrane recepter protein